TTTDRGPNGATWWAPRSRNPEGPEASLAAGLMIPDHHTKRREELAGWPVTIETYRLGEVYHCTVSNVDPGARIARADGSSREEAESRAVEKATRYLAQTRRFTT